MSTRLEVQAPRIHCVHPTWFEAGKPIELLLCGSSLDQPKFRYNMPLDVVVISAGCFSTMYMRYNISCLKLLLYVLFSNLSVYCHKFVMWAFQSLRGEI